MWLLTKKASDVRQTIVRLQILSWARQTTGMQLVFRLSDDFQKKGVRTDPPGSRPCVVHVRPPCECLHNVTCSYAEKWACLDSWLQLNHQQEVWKSREQLATLLHTYSTCIAPSTGRKKKECMRAATSVWLSWFRSDFHEIWFDVNLEHFLLGINSVTGQIYSERVWRVMFCFVLFFYVG